MRTEQELKALLQKFSEGRYSPEEERLLRLWLKEAGRPQEVEGLSAEDRGRMLKDFVKADRFKKQPGALVRSMTRGRTAGVAAAFAGILLFSWMLLNNKGPFHTKNRTFIQIVTASGEVRRVVLPDSSVVWLNANTQLAYDAAFSKYRSVRLKGEALFEVTEDKAHPFTIQTQDSLVTEVLGTRFNIRSYEQLQETRVSVLSGKVAVTQPFLHLSMGAYTQNESLHFYRSKDNYVRTKGEDTTALLGWRTGQWELKDCGMGELAVLLYNQFNITLVNRNKALEALRIDANFNRQQTAEEIVSTFSLLAGCHYRWVNNTTVELY